MFDKFIRFANHSILLFVVVYFFLFYCLAFLLPSATDWLLINVISEKNETLNLNPNWLQFCALWVQCVLIQSTWWRNKCVRLHFWHCLLQKPHQFPERFMVAKRWRPVREQRTFVSVHSEAWRPRLARSWHCALGPSYRQYLWLSRTMLRFAAAETCVLMHEILCIVSI